MRHGSLVLLALLVVATAACGGVGGTGGSDPGAAPADPAAAAAAQLDEEELDDFGCGYAFTLGTADETVRLSLWSDANHGEPPETGTHELGDTWTGELVTGRDLFAQWCDDVMEPDEPEVVEEREWEVAGTLTWELVEGDGQCPSVATGTLREAAVVTDDGTVDLPSLDLRNEFFGCFAG